MSIPHHNVVGKILDSAAANGWLDETALREGRRSLTYRQLGDEIARAAGAFESLGVEQGDRVAIYMPDSLEAVLAILGAIYRGAIAVPISELGRANDVRDILNNCGAVAVVTHARLQTTIDEIHAEVGALREVVVTGSHLEGQRDFREMLDAATPAAAPAPVSGDAVALLFYSAGASVEGPDGQRNRRGVPHSHQTPASAFDSFGRKFLDLSARDRVFSVVRLSTSYGLSAGLLFPLMAGSEAMLLPEQPRSKSIFDVIEHRQPTVMLATPSVYGQLARDAVGGARQKPLQGLRACISGAEDMPARVVERVQRDLGVDAWVGYGLTEAFGFVVCGSANTQRPGACGRPMAGFELRIVGDEGELVGVDEIGTLEIRGPTVAPAYWGESTTILDSEGWFRTRDRFMVDDQGNYYHCGRVDHLFKVGGKWVSPTEVEHALLSNEKVWECVVIGADDEDGLIKPLAFVVPNIGHTASDELALELREFVKQELAPYKYPRWIEFMDELPKGPHGKVLRYKLRERIRGGRQGRRAATAGP